MKSRTTFSSCLLAALLLLPSALPAAPATGDSPADFPYVVPIELGDIEFLPGDTITITEVRGTSDKFTTNESYSVVGTYTLTSHDEADLGFHSTSSNPNPTPIEPNQTAHITKGTGTFRLIKTVHEDGYLHISFYAGSSFGGVYFGQGQWVLRKKNWSASSPSTPKPSTSTPASTTAQSLCDYLGDPVPTPQNLDPAYSRQGLTDAVLLAAANAGISLVQVDIDDSEFPFLLGVVSREGDYEKLIAQLKTVNAYEYGGSVGSSTRHAFNLTPWRIFPSDAGQRIARRLTLREQILSDKISGR